jgi:Zn-finger nucleic acid-binding protein
VDLVRDLSRDHLKPKVCPAGHGVFLESDELAVLFAPDALEALRRAVDASGFGDAVCPRCATAMRAFPFTHLQPGGSGGRARVVGVEVDGCAACGGMWFDKGEVEPVVGESFVESAAPRPLPRRAAPPGADGDAWKPQGESLWRRIGETVWDLLLWATLRRHP